MYLPGIGEAIGGILRVQRQNELWTKAQDILKDETKPMADRLQLVGVAYPELANTEDFKERITQARLFDQDKREAAKFEQEQAQQRKVQDFVGVLETLDPAARADLLRKNKDLARLAAPEELDAIIRDDERAANFEEWGVKDRINFGQQLQIANIGAAATAGAAGAQAADKLAADVAAGIRRPDGSYVPAAEINAAKDAQAVALAAAKSEALAGVKAEAETARLDKVTARQVELFDDLAAMREEGAFIGPQKSADIKSKEAEIVDLEARRRTPVGTEPNSTLVEQIRQEYGFDDSSSGVGMAVPSMLGGGSGFRAARTAINERRAGMGLPPIPEPVKGEQKKFKPRADSINQGAR